MNTQLSMPTTMQNLPIQNLGTPSIVSPLANMITAGERRTVCFVDEDLLEDGQEPQAISFEMAGPRKNIFFEPSKTRCAIVTCGGLCPGINDVIRSIVITAYNDYHIPSVIGIPYGLKGFIAPNSDKIRELTPHDVESIHDIGGTILGTSRGPQSPSAIVATLLRLDVNILFVIGGDGTMQAAATIHQEIEKQGHAISVIGIPKTIDNDINFIPYSFGFETAVDKAAEAIRSVYTEATSVQNGVGIVKLMGRESGFIAAYAALSERNVNFVLVPEVPFTLHGKHGLLPAIERCLADKSHAVLAVAEGAGQDIIPKYEQRYDASGNKCLGDISGFLYREIAAYLSSKNIPCYMKYVDPSYMIRSVPANYGDKLYSGFLGQHAVHAAISGKTGAVVAKIMDKFVYLPLELVTRKRRTMRQNSDLWQSVLETTGQASMMGMLAQSEHSL